MKYTPKKYSWLKRRGACYKIMEVLDFYDILYFKAPKGAYRAEAEVIYALLKHNITFFNRDYMPDIRDAIKIAFDVGFGSKYYLEQEPYATRLYQAADAIQEIYEQPETRIYEFFV